MADPAIVVELLHVYRPKRVTTGRGSTLKMTVVTADNRDLDGGEIDALFVKFHLPDGARFSLRRGRLRRRRTRFRATYNTHL